jgi:hypothetical protein
MLAPCRTEGQVAFGIRPGNGIIENTLGQVDHSGNSFVVGPQD